MTTQLKQRKAPALSLPTAGHFSLEEAYKRGPVILVFFEGVGSEF